MDRHALQPNLLHVFTAGQISTTIAEAECAEMRGPASVAYEQLSSLRFDQAPVVDRGRVVGWVLTKNLPAISTVKKAMTGLERSAIVSKEASIADVLQLLAKHSLVFTVDETGLYGFVTPSDFERHAARSHFYLLIAGIEMLLAGIVGERVPAVTILGCLDGESRERWKADLADGQETKPTEYLYLRDLAELFAQISDISDKYGWDTELSNALTEICQFRPSVMHPSRSLIKGRNSAQLAALASRAERVTAALEVIAARRGESG